jgi:SAM-dependent methyltransferase
MTTLSGTSAAQRLSAASFEDADYVDLLSLIGGTNRPPGGKRTVAAIARRLLIGPHTKVLEIGSNTGFTSIELVKLTGCTSVGVDVNSTAVAASLEWRDRLPSTIAERIDFRIGDATELPFEDEAFDVIVCGGATTFVADREAALRDYARVLRPYGFLAVTNLYYRTTPDPELLADLRAVLGFDVPVWDAERWTSLFFGEGWELFDRATTALTSRPDDILIAYVEALTSAEELPGLDERQREAVRRRWLEVIAVFNRNHDHLGYLELTLRKEQPGLAEQAELFLAPGVYDPYFSRAVVTGDT